ncbi:MAG TPA: VRR-NUC domain-containing protein [Gammaproteobacteria bacterium]|nr:VRR-NUC domain-containing protein [Gammaproteobacteria bacterium]
MRESKIWRQIRDALSCGPRRIFRNEVGNGVAIRHKHPFTRQAIISECIALAEKRGGSGSRIAFGLARGSGDLIGWETVEVTQEMVGTKVAVFTSIETKTATGATRPDQAAWLEAVNRAGGKAIIARSVEDARQGLTGC